MPALRLVEIHRCATEQLVAPHPEAAVIVATDFKLTGWRIDAEAGEKVRPIDVPSKHEWLNIKIGKSCADFLIDLERRKAQRIIGDARPDPEAVVAAKYLLVRHPQEPENGSPGIDGPATGGGAVRLAPLGDVLMIGEGIETCLAAMQATELPAWAALSTSGLRAVDLPARVGEVIVLADGDDAGEAAARSCALRWKGEGRRVRIARPPHGSDFNDVLLGGLSYSEDSTA